MEYHIFLVAIHRFDEQNTMGKRHYCWRFCEKNGLKTAKIWCDTINHRTAFQDRLIAEYIKIFATTALFFQTISISRFFPLYIQSMWHMFFFFFFTNEHQKNDIYTCNNFPAEYCNSSSFHSTAHNVSKMTQHFLIPMTRFVIVSLCNHYHLLCDILYPLT